MTPVRLNYIVGIIKGLVLAGYGRSNFDHQELLSKEWRLEVYGL